MLSDKTYRQIAVSMVSKIIAQGGHVGDGPSMIMAKKDKYGNTIGFAIYVGEGFEETIKMDAVYESISPDKTAEEYVNRIGVVAAIKFAIDWDETHRPCIIEVM